MKQFTIVIIVLCSLSFCQHAKAQQDPSVLATPKADTINPASKVKTADTATAKPKPKPKHDPRIATRRSLIFPGLGQIYNREYWKLPIVYGALSIPTITFFYNNTWYKRTKEAYELRFAAEKVGATKQDTLNLENINPKLKGLSTGSLQSYRNIFRRDRDYSVLWFLIVWGLNVADATVFAHLKEFDVSENISMKVKPSINPLTKNNEMKLVFHFKKPEKKVLSIR
jgi:hypothetical protein